MSDRPLHWRTLFLLSKFDSITWRYIYRRGQSVTSFRLWDDEDKDYEIVTPAYEMLEREGYVTRFPAPMQDYRQGWRRVDREGQASPRRTGASMTTTRDQLIELSRAIKKLGREIVAALDQGFVGKIVRWLSNRFLSETYYEVWYDVVTYDGAVVPDRKSLPLSKAEALDLIEDWRYQETYRPPGSGGIMNTRLVKVTKRPIKRFKL